MENTIWDDAHIKALLGAYRYPPHLISTEPWASWLRLRGGQRAVLQALHTSGNFSATQQRLLTVLLDKPGCHADYYAQQVGLSRAAYFIHLDHLIQAIKRHLAAWSVPAEEAHPPASLAERMHIALPPTSFIGRHNEVQTVLALLEQPNVRMVTFTGVGGTGKTRLALQVAACAAGRYTHGVAVVPLATVDDSTLVLPTIAHTLGVQDHENQPLLEALIAHLASQHKLLLLDNVEQVADSAPLFVTLLEAAPQLTIIMTSRTRLRVAWEHEFFVPPLEVPSEESRAALEQVSSVALFAARAKAVNPSFTLTAENIAAVAEICIRLDGLPLAIELAAARSRILSPQAMIDRLVDRFALLRTTDRDVPPRHQTLRQTMDWSYDLLDDHERLLFARLSVFVGGWQLDAAEAICRWGDEPGTFVLDGLDQLLDHSLVQHQIELTGEPRFTMLETIREYARTHLIASQAHDDLCERHATYYLTLAERASTARDDSAQEQWHIRLEIEHGNLRAALRWWIDRHDPCVLRLCAALWRFWLQCHHLREGRRWMQAALTATDRPTVERMQVLQGAGRLAFEQGDYAQAHDLLREAAIQQRAMHDDAGLADTLSHLGQIAYYQGRLDEARHHLEESLAIQRQRNDITGIADALLHLGVVLFHLADLDQAAQLQIESLRLFRQVEDRVGISTALNRLAQIALHRRDPQGAIQLSEESRAVQQKGPINARCLGFTLINLSFAYFVLGDTARAIQYQRDSLQQYQTINHKEGLAWNLMMLGGMYAAGGDGERGAQLCGAAEKLREQIQCPFPPLVAAEHQQYMTTFRAHYGAPMWDAAWSAGRHLSLAQAIARALEP